MLQSIEEVPAITSTPLELLAWYNTHETIFTEASTSPFQNPDDYPEGSNERKIAQNTVAIRKKLAEFEAVYEKVAQKYSTTLAKLEEELSEFQTTNITAANYSEKVAEFQKISERLDITLEQSVP